MDKVKQGIPVYYLTGNHDDALRRFTDVQIGDFYLLDKLVLEIHGKSYWIFHGDVFDPSVSHSKWIAKMGGHAYDYLIRLNRLINHARRKLGLEPLSFSKKIKASIKKAAKHIGDFEQTAIDLAFQNTYDYVVCGHIHQPTIKTITRDSHTVTYMNSGDWVESLTSLEYTDGQWRLFEYVQEVIKSEMGAATINQSSIQQPLESALDILCHPVLK